MMYKERQKKNYSWCSAKFANLPVVIEMNLVTLALLFVVGLFIGLIFFPKNTEVQTIIKTDTLTTVDTVIKNIEIPFIQTKYIYVTKEKIVHDTVINHDTTVVTKTEIKTLPADTIKIPCPKKCHYEYERVFHENRYPKHGPLWRIKDSTIKCK